jgi:O-antigen ligase
MKYLERIYLWLLLSPAVLPLVVWGSVIYPNLVPKILLFYSLVLVSIAVGIVLTVYGTPFFYSRLQQWEVWIPGALLALAYATSIVGIDFYHSFWSLFVRGDGLLMLTCAVSSFYLMLLSADRKLFERLLRGVAGIATLVSLYGIGEWLTGGGRIGSLLGNAAFFAGYLGIAFFVTLTLLPTLSRKWRITVSFCAGLQIIAIILTATRGTLLALLGTLVLYLVYRMFSPGKFQRSAQGILAILIIVAGVFFTFRNELAQVPFEPIARIASVSTADADIANRLFVWRSMLSEAKKSLWTGVGAEHIDVLFNRFYDPTKISEQWFDRTHNAFLDYLVQYGIGGLVLYILLIGTFITTAIRFTRSRKNEYEKHIAEMFSLLAVMYAIQNFFVFDTVSSFWLILALLALFLSIVREDTPQTLSLPVWSRYVGWVTALGLIVAILFVSVRPALSAHNLLQAYKYQIVDVTREVHYLSAGVALGTYGDIEYGYQAYDMYTSNQYTALTGQSLTDAYQIAVSILTNNFARYPYDARTALYLAQVLSLAPSGATIDSELLKSALDRATNLSPKRAQTWYIIVNLAIGEANTHPVGSPERIAGYATARAFLSRYIDLVPTLSAPHFVLAQLDLAMGDTETASKEAEKGKNGYWGDTETARRAVAYYESVRDWKNAQFFLSEIIRFEPNDTSSLYDLAKVTYLLGDYEGSEKIVMQLRAKNPKILETDKNFLTAITAYEQSKK